jgi:hypothetical protein
MLAHVLSPYSLLREACKARRVITDTICSSLVPLTMKRRKRPKWRERQRHADERVNEGERHERDSGSRSFWPNVPLMMSLIMPFSGIKQKLPVASERET